MGSSDEAVPNLSFRFKYDEVLDVINEVWERGDKKNAIEYFINNGDNVSESYMKVLIPQVLSGKKKNAKLLKMLYGYLTPRMEMMQEVKIKLQKINP